MATESAKAQLYDVLTQEKRQPFLEKRHSFSVSHVMSTCPSRGLRDSLSLSPDEMRSIDNAFRRKSMGNPKIARAFSQHVTDANAIQQQNGHGKVTISKEHRKSDINEVKNETKSPVDDVKDVKEAKDENMHDTWSKISHSVEKIRKKLHLRTKGKSDVRIHVEYIDCDSQEKLWPYGDESDGAGDVFDDTLDFPDHNYTPSLFIKDISNGLFNAVFPLNALPKGDLTIRIRNYKMEIVVGRRPSSVESKHRITYPIRYGDIDIPIFVEPSSLDFRFDSMENLIYVCGQMKGCGGAGSPYHHRLHGGGESLSPIKHVHHRKLSLPLTLSDLRHVVKVPHADHRTRSSHHSLDGFGSPTEVPHNRIADLRSSMLPPIRRVISPPASSSGGAQRFLERRHQLLIGDFGKNWFRDRAMTH